MPAGIALTSAYASQLLTATLRVNIGGWALFLVILAAAVLVAYLGIRTSSWVDLVLAAGRTLVDLLPFAALGWLVLGVFAAAILRTRRPASFEMLGRVFTPAKDDQHVP